MSIAIINLAFLSSLFLFGFIETGAQRTGKQPRYRFHLGADGGEVVLHGAEALGKRADLGGDFAGIVAGIGLLADETWRRFVLRARCLTGVRVFAP